MKTSQKSEFKMGDRIIPIGGRSVYEVLRHCEDQYLMVEHNMPGGPVMWYKQEFIERDCILLSTAQERLHGEE